MTEPNDVPPPPDPSPAPAPSTPSSSAPYPTAAPGAAAPPPYTDPQAQPAGSLPYEQPLSGPPPYTGAPPTADDRTMATLAHVLAIFTSFVGPLIIWMIKKDQSPFVDDQGKEALNFQLTLLIGYLISAVATVICIGPFIALGLSVVAIVFGIMAAVATNKGEAYRYPFNIRFIK